MEKFISIFFVSTIKFIFAFPLAYKLKITCLHTIICTTAGGISGILFFSFFWQHLIRLYFWLIHIYLHKHPKIRSRLKQIKNFFVRPNKKISFKQKRRYLWLRENFGLLGIAFLTPILLSIPLGTFLAVRFYNRNIKTLIILILMVIFWSIILSCLIHFTTFKY